MSLPIPPGATSRLPEIRAANGQLIAAFEAHPSFAVQQAQGKGKIYFMWDFARRTNATIESILQGYPPPYTPATRDSIPNEPVASMDKGKVKELKEDAVGRCLMLHRMITDTSGMSAMMFGEEPGKGVDLGDAVRNAAKNVDEVISASGNDPVHAPAA